MTTPSPRLDGGHTPGPWRLDIDGNERMVVSETARDDDDEEVLVCDLFRGGYDYRDLGFSADATARLIAAAPDMLEALVGIVTHWEACEQGPGHSHEVPGVWGSDNHPGLAGTRCEWCAQWSKARAAITRARGKDHA